jgi:putative colanic acid biosynthesis UDP-glucose lipid carrier transferase
MLYDVEGFHYAALAPGLPPAAWDGVERRAPRASKTVQLALKRSLDIVASLLLLVLLAPLLIAIAVAIRLLDGSPVIYRQQRYGKAGSTFAILKFRTMVCAEGGSNFVQVRRADPRVTRLGAFLRRTSLDELPQLINVLRGDMSLVGPRPHALSMEEHNFATYPRATRRLAMRPGMTGLAQVRGLRGPTATRQQLTARLDADVDYVEGWSLWRDVMILASTPSAWILGENAH